MSIPAMIEKPHSAAAAIGFRSAVLGLIVLLTGIARAQTSTSDAPWFGAEMCLEPGDKPADIDTWFRQLKAADMEVTRIRLFERYMRTPSGAWDFSLFDEAYRAGEKYGIKIYGNLYPDTALADEGGFKFPRTEAHWQSVREYIRAAVTHFRSFKSCYGWVPINEPGVGQLPDEAFTRDRFKAWAAAQPPAAYHGTGYASIDFSAERFQVDYNGWYLRELVREIHACDPGSIIHVNPHNVFQNAAEYDLRDWTGFLSSLGGSAHMHWHFGYFNRDQYAVAFSAESEMIRSGAGGRIPWFMTEILGGNVIYDGHYPVCPTPEEFSQWLWLTLATESKGAMFWCLNPRRSDYTAGESALLNFQNEPSERMRMISTVAKTVKRDGALWAHARTVESGISILYTRESLWVEKKLEKPDSIPTVGRDPGEPCDRPWPTLRRWERWGSRPTSRRWTIMTSPARVLRGRRSFSPTRSPFRRAPGKSWKDSYPGAGP